MPKTTKSKTVRITLTVHRALRGLWKDKADSKGMRLPAYLIAIIDSAHGVRK